jgi:hypothetical protein
MLLLLVEALKATRMLDGTMVSSIPHSNRPVLHAAFSVMIKSGTMLLMRLLLGQHLGS